MDTKKTLGNKRTCFESLSAIDVRRLSGFSSFGATDERRLLSSLSVATDERRLSCSSYHINLHITQNIYYLHMNGSVY